MQSLDITENGAFFIGREISSDVEYLVYQFVLETDGNYRISVFNTGKTISEENPEEMWSNFYRGDKSNRREEGRFGLGLSIVAAIQNMHSMKYGCENKDNGVGFWFDVKNALKICQFN